MAKPPDNLEVQIGAKKFGFNFESGAQVLHDKTFAIAQNNFVFGIQQPPLIISFEGDKRFDDLTDYARNLNNAVEHKDVKSLTRSLGLSRVDAQALIKSKGQEREEKYTEIFDAKIQEAYGGYDKDVSGAAKGEEALAALGLKLADLEKMDKKTFESALTGAVEKKIAEIGPEKTKELLAKFVQDVNSDQDHADEKYKRITTGNVEYTRLLGKDSPNPDIGPVCRHVAPLMGAMMAAAGRDNQVFTCRVGNPELMRRGKMNPDQHVSVLLLKYFNVAEATDLPAFSYKKTAVAITDNSSNGKCFIFYDKRGNVQYYDNIPREGFDLVQHERERFPEQLASVKRFIEQHRGGAQSAFDEQIKKDTTPQNLDYFNLSSELKTPQQRETAPPSR